MFRWRLRPGPVLRLIIVLGLVSALTMLASQACASPEADVPGIATSQDAPPIGCTEYFEPLGAVPTFSEKPFWIVLGLVVLGWLVLAADFPPEHYSPGEG